MPKLREVSQITTITLLILLVSLPLAAFQAAYVSAWDNEFIHPHLCASSLELLPEGSAMHIEMAEHMGDIQWGATDEDVNDVIYQYDDSSYALWNPTITHFWDADSGPHHPYTLLSTPFVAVEYENAYEKSLALLTKALDRYEDDDMMHAYRLLGRVAHLMQDMAVPAHAHEDMHVDFPLIEPISPFGVDDECLEEWFLFDYGSMSKPYLNPTYAAEARAQGLIEFPEDVEAQMRHGNWSAGLYYLMYTTNQVADYFASDFASGDREDPEGWMDYSSFPNRPTGFWDLWDNDQRLQFPYIIPVPDETNLDVDGDLSRIVDCTIPYAIRAVATLYKIFYELTHAPTATIAILPPADLDGDGAADHKWVRLNVTYDVGALDYYRDLEARLNNDGGDWTEWKEVGAQPRGRIVSWMLSEGNGSKTVHYEVRNLLGLTDSDEASIYLKAWRMPLVFPYTITATGAESVDIDLDVLVPQIAVMREPEGADRDSLTCNWNLYREPSTLLAPQATWPHNLVVWFPDLLTGVQVFSDIPVPAGDQVYLSGSAAVPATLDQPEDKWFMGSIRTDLVEIPRIITPLGEATDCWIAGPTWWDQTGGVRNTYWEFSASFWATYTATADIPQTESGEAYVEYGVGYEEVASAEDVKAKVDWTTQWEATVDNPAIDYYMVGPTLYARTTKLAPEMVLAALSPVDVEITDPLGRTISRRRYSFPLNDVWVTTNEIPGASIWTTDFDGDGDTDVLFAIDGMMDEMAGLGDYTIRVSPSVHADPADTYSLTLSTPNLPQGGIFLSRDVQLADIPPGGQNWTITQHQGPWITPPNLSPKAEANGPYRASEGTPVEFDARNSNDPDGTSLTYRWDFEDDGNWDTDWSSNPTASHTWSDDWTGTARLQVSDGALIDTSTAAVTITNARPIANAGSNQLATPGAEVHFSGTFTDSGGLDTHMVTWDFGDETAITNTLTPNHVYTEPGKYTVTLWVYDNDGGVGSDTLTVNTGVQVLIDPQLVFAPPGKSTAYNVLVHHLGTTDQTYDLALLGLEPTWYALSTTAITLGPGQSASVTLTVSPPITAAIGTYTFAVVAASPTDPQIWDRADAGALVATAQDLGLEEIPPVTTLAFGRPAYVDSASGKTFVSSSTLFTLTAEDNPGGVGVTNSAYMVFSYDHAEYATGWIPVSLPTSFSIVGVADGRYNIAFYSQDGLGNTETIKIVTVFIDTSPPATSMAIEDPVYTDLPSNVTYVTPTTAFQLESIDLASGIGTTSYRITNTTYDADWVDYTGSFCLDKLTNGEYTLMYQSTDRVSNIEPTRTLDLMLVRAYDCPGDINGDGECNLFDLVLMVKCLGLTSEDDGWNAVFDFTNDSVINIFDLVTCASQYGS